MLSLVHFVLEKRHHVFPRYKVPINVYTHVHAQAFTMSVWCGAIHMMGKPSSPWFLDRTHPSENAWEMNGLFVFYVISIPSTYPLLSLSFPSRGFPLQCTLTDIPADVHRLLLTPRISHQGTQRLLTSVVFFVIDRYKALICNTGPE